jgi:hypothetical protein
MNKKIFLIFSLIFLMAYNSQAQEEKYISLFVYNFTKYFDWPEASKANDFRIQVLGHKSVYDALAVVTAGKTVGTQKIVVEHLVSLDQLSSNINILFIGHWQTRYIESIREQLKGKSVLLVAESEGLLNQGVAINFIIRDEKIKFEYNPNNAKNAGLKIDPRLRELAYSVIE